MVQQCTFHPIFFFLLYSCIQYVRLFKNLSNIYSYVLVLTSKLVICTSAHFPWSNMKKFHPFYWSFQRSSIWFYEIHCFIIIYLLISAFTLIASFIISLDLRVYVCFNDPTFFSEFHRSYIFFFWQVDHSF